MDGPLFIFDRGSGSRSFNSAKFVERPRHRHPVVAAEVADLAFYAALFVALAWSAEARLRSASADGRR